MKELSEKIFLKLDGASKVVFVGIGEEKLADDGVGPYISSELLDYSNEKVLFINAGIDIMGRIDEIIDFKPSHLVLLDTCTLNASPGTVAILERENIKDSVSISTHTIPVFVVIDLIVEKLPLIQVFMIGLVPESLEGFTELKLYKADKYTLEERSENVDLPFFDLRLTDTIQKVADEIILIIKDFIQKL